MLDPSLQGRKPHMNRGPQITRRVLLVTCWMVQSGAIDFQHLQQLLARFSPKPTALKQPGMLSAERTRKFLRRWIDEDLYVYKVFYHRQKGWIWPTRKAIQLAGLNLRYYEPAPASLAHVHAVNQVRLTVGARRPDDVWKSERMLRAEQDARTQGSKVAHLPDAELHMKSGVIALEVEITQKGDARLADILLDLASNQHYKAVWYFVPEQVQPAVTRAIGKLPSDVRKRFTVYDLDGKEYKDEFPGTATATASQQRR